MNYYYIKYNYINMLHIGYAYRSLYDSIRTNIYYDGHKAIFTDVYSDKQYSFMLTDKQKADILNKQMLLHLTLTKQTPADIMNNGLKLSPSYNIQHK